MNSSYAETTVTTEDQLQTAINNNEDIVINYKYFQLQSQLLFRILTIKQLN